MEKYKRVSVCIELKEYCHFAKENDYMEVTVWYNGEGFDVAVDNLQIKNFSLTLGEYKALKKAIKKLNEEE